MNESIYIFGLGAIGSNLLLQLAKVYPDKTFHGIDFDIVEDRNLRTQAFYKEHKKAPKAIAMQAVLSRHLAKPKYKPMKLKVEKPLGIGENSLAIDCFDNTVSRQILKDSKYKNLLHVGFSVYEFGNAEISWTENYTLTKEAENVEGIDVCTLDSAGPFIHFVVNLAAMEVINFIENDKKQDYLVTGMNRIKRV